MANGGFSKIHKREVYADTGKLRGGKNLFRSIMPFGCSKCPHKSPGHFGICEVDGCKGVAPLATMEAQAALQAWTDTKAKVKMGAAPYQGGTKGQKTGSSETYVQRQATNNKLEAEYKKQKKIWEPKGWWG